MENKGLKVFEYVIMSSHIHLIAQDLSGQLASTIRDFKSHTAKEILKSMNKVGESRRKWLEQSFRYYAAKTAQNKEFMVWQKTNHPIELTTPKIYDQKSNYIIMNPVVAGLTTDESTWKYSSGCPLSPLNVNQA